MKNTKHDWVLYVLVAVLAVFFVISLDNALTQALGA